jgi:hypothetical protein
MHSGNWLGRIWGRMWAGVVQDVPPSLEACEACRRTDCTEKTWRVCAERLATEAVAVYGVEALAPLTNRTDELPEVEADSGGGVVQAPADPACSHSRKLSTC